ncbi:MAG: RNA polymerase sigma factor [Bacteroidota bacterium]
MTDEELVSKCITGDRKYQEMLYKKYASKMFGVCLGYISDRDAAKDILQEGFIKVFTSLKNYKGEGSLEGWIRRIIINTAIDHYRVFIRDHRNLHIEEISTAAFEVSLPDKILEKELLELIHKLPEGARIIFNLYVVEGYSHNEIAEMLNITKGTSKSQFSRARVLLQHWIGKLYNVKMIAETFKNA